MSDRILGVAGLILAAFFAWSTTLIQESFMTDVVGPKVFPLIIAAVVGLSSLYFILKPDPNPTWPSLKRFAEVGMAAGVSFLYAWILPDLGFLISTALASAYLTWRLGTKPLQSLIVGVAISVGIYVIFGLLFGLSLAKGPLGF